MSFGLLNAPSFYSCMMGHFKQELDALFFEVLESYADKKILIDGKPVRIVNGNITQGLKIFIVALNPKIQSEFSAG